MIEREVPEGGGKDFKVSRHLERARAFLNGYAQYINPGMIEDMARQLALVLIQENTSDTAERSPPPEENS